MNPSSLFGGRFVSLEKRIQNVTAVVLIVIILGLVAAAAWYAYRLRLKGTLLVIASAMGIALTVFTMHSMWQLNHVDRANATEPIVLRRTAPDVALLLSDLQEVSRRLGDDTISITVDDRVGQPVRWYLRQFLNVSTARVGSATKTPIVIVPADGKDAASKSLGRAYVNQRYRLRSTFAPEAPLDRWLRWAHVREQVNPPQTDDIVAFYQLPS
jgi:hypothetical protein